MAWCFVSNYLRVRSFLHSSQIRSRVIPEVFVITTYVFIIPSEFRFVSFSTKAKPSIRGFEYWIFAYPMYIMPISKSSIRGDFGISAISNFIRFGPFKKVF